MEPVVQIAARPAIVSLSPLAGVALAALVRRFDGAERISTAWMAAGALGVAVTSIVLATSPGTAGLGLGGRFWLSLGLGLALLALIAVDVAAFRLPDLITLPLAGVGLTLGDLAPASRPERLAGSAMGLAAMVAANALYVRWRGRPGLGMGDAKLFAAAGAWIGVAALPSVLLFACAAGLAWFALSASIRGRSALQDRLPFGAPLCCAFWLLWLTG